MITTPTVPHDWGQQNEALRRALGRPLPAPGTPSSLDEQLLAVARRLTLYRPTDRMTDGARLSITFVVTGGAEASRPLLRVLPWPTDNITRGEYALHLRRIAHASRTQMGDAR